MHKGLVARLVAFSTVVVLAPSSSALPEILDAFTARYETSSGKLNTCQVCHSSSSGFNFYGSALEAELGKNGGDLEAAFTALEERDSDEDGYSNREEIDAGSWPGDPHDVPVAVEAISWAEVKGKYLKRR